MKATVDLIEVYQMLLARMERDDARSDNEDFDNGRKFGVGEAAELFRALLALSSARAQESEPAA